MKFKIIFFTLVSLSLIASQQSTNLHPPADDNRRIAVLCDTLINSILHDLNSAKLNQKVVTSDTYHDYVTN